jgi:hypothetical protein
MAEAGGEHLAPGGVLQHLRDRVHDGLEDQLRILLDTVRPRVRDRDRPPDLGDGPQLVVEQRRLDGCRALVDAEQQGGAHFAVPWWRAARVHQCPSVANAGGAGSGRTGPGAIAL